MDVIMFCSRCGYREKFAIVAYELWDRSCRQALEENHIIPNAYLCPECGLGQVTILKGK